MAPIERHPTFAPTHRRRQSSAASLAEIVAKRPGARRLSMNSTPQGGTAVTAPSKSWLSKALAQPQLSLAILISSTFLLGVGVSLVFDSSLDTSVLAHVHNHSAPRTAYFAQKSNLFNQLFVKRCWGWTSAMFLLHLITAPRNSSAIPPTRRPVQHHGPGTGTFSPSGRATRSQRLASFIIASTIWIAFTSWFFGAGLGDRIIALSGGACAVPLPRDLPIDPGSLESLLPVGIDSLIVHGTGQLYLPLSQTYCFVRRPLTPSNHPQLFSVLESLGASTTSLRLPPARWSGGFDISGHAFLLTLSAMVLAKELAPSWRVLSGRSAPSPSRGLLGLIHGAVTIVASALVALWVWMLCMTAIYFHNPPEKITGLVAGLVAAGLVNLLTPHVAGSPVIEFKTRGPTRRPSPHFVDADTDENFARREAVFEIPKVSSPTHEKAE